MHAKMRFGNPIQWKSLSGLDEMKWLYGQEMKNNIRYSFFPHLDTPKAICCPRLVLLVWYKLQQNSESWELGLICRNTKSLSVFLFSLVHKEDYLNWFYAVLYLPFTQKHLIYPCSLTWGTLQRQLRNGGDKLVKEHFCRSLAAKWTDSWTDAAWRLYPYSKCVVGIIALYLYWLR